MDLAVAVRPVDRVVAAYNGVMALVWATLVGSGGYATAIVIAHAAAAALPWLISRVRQTSGVMRSFIDLSPLIMLAAFWPELDLLRIGLPAVGHDDVILMLDQRMFGTHLHATWLPSMPHVWLSELMHAFYFGYYPLIVLPALALLVRQRRDALHDLSLRLMVAYVACYLIYIPFPVYGPSLTLGHFAGPHTDGLLYRVVASARQVGDSPGTAFPSSHVVGAVTLAVVGWRWFSRPVAWLMTIEALGVLLSTVYTQHHYGIDAVAGLGLALGVQFIIVPMLGGATRAPAEPSPAVLPEYGWVPQPATSGEER